MIKNYSISRKICLLCLIFPFVILLFLHFPGNEDIWYILNYGKHILSSGFPHTDFLSMHSNLHIVVQQPLTAVLFYLIYKFLGGFGLIVICYILIGLYLFILYRLCMLISGNKKFLSIIVSVITVFLLEICGFITIRSQLFTYLFLVVILYIMELFYRNNQSKSIYFLPLISVLQINFHAAMWYMIFLFILPYVAQLVIDKNKSVIKIIILLCIMFLVGFINPYTYENVFFFFNTYDNSINVYIDELYPINLFSNHIYILYYSIIFFIIFFFSILICSKHNIYFRHVLLFFGTSFLAFSCIRNIAFFIIGSLSILGSYLDFNVELKDTTNTNNKIAFLLIILLVFITFFQSFSCPYEYGLKLLKNRYNVKNVVLYSSSNFGSYAEYIGFKPYIDSRAEVFTKKANNKEDIWYENYLIENGYIDIDKFINKYKFTHFIVYKNTFIYRYLYTNKGYSLIYNSDKYDYAIFVDKKYKK